MSTAHARDGRFLLAPLTIFLLAMLGLPLAVDLIYSLSRVEFATILSPQFVGLENYGQALRSESYWQAAWFSLRFGLIAALAQLLLGLFLAIFLAPLIDKRPWLLAFLMLPMMVAPALVGLMYRLILHEFVGVVPWFLFTYWGDSPSFLGPDNAFTTLVVVEVLQWTPFALLILYSAYAAVPAEVREAAAIDGAGPWRRLWAIDLPLMAPAMGAAFFIRFIDGFRVFDNVYTLTGAGAGGSTTTMSIWVYQAFFKSGDIGQAVAASMLLLAASWLVLALVHRVSERRA
ncbi:carbohydrate ABC transporter permease [Geminicoccus roseus]|uniref:carbohydrate ABC transporter permease n=1 Tax=Geminicoccus roseus TaxID=404900 RepID=UPI0003FF927A|nr:sugar ABC transporter permease [Geminicoccus roseus]